MLLKCSYVAFSACGVWAQILRFRAWYKGTVHESATESYLVRKVDIFYYLVDDSMAVVETAVENSGLPHGTSSFIQSSCCMRCQNLNSSSPCMISVKDTAAIPV